MNTAILKSAGIDYDYGVKRFVGRANLFEKALRKFPKDDSFFRIQAAFEQGNRQALLASAHEFKGMCGNIGLTSLYEAADVVVQLLRGGVFSSTELTKAYNLLKEQYQSVCGAVIAAEETE